jgi:hypothetical protein
LLVNILKRALESLSFGKFLPGYNRAIDIVEIQNRAMGSAQRFKFVYGIFIAAAVSLPFPQRCYNTLNYI